MEATLAVAGTRLVADVYVAKKPRAGVLLVHGFNSCAKEFGSLPEELAEAGYAAVALDLRGHGRSGGERGRLDLQRAVQDIDAGLDHLRTLVGRKRPLAIIGHSLGAALSIGYAARHDRIQCLVAAHPVQRLFDELGLAERTAYHVIGRIGARRRRANKPAGMLPRRVRYDELFVDAGARRRAEADPFLAPKVNTGNYAFATTMDSAAWAKQVRVPTLVIQSPHDQTVKPENTARVAASLAGPVERLTHRGGHSCWRDLDGDRISTEVVGFLRRHLEA